MIKLEPADMQLLKDSERLEFDNLNGVRMVSLKPTFKLKQLKQKLASVIDFTSDECGDFICFDDVSTYNPNNEEHKDSMFVLTKGSNYISIIIRKNGECYYNSNHDGGVIDYRVKLQLLDGDYILNLRKVINEGHL